jgi:hypothetical protein
MVYVYALCGYNSFYFSRYLEKQLFVSTAYAAALELVIFLLFSFLFYFNAELGLCSAVFPFPFWFKCCLDHVSPFLAMELQIIVLSLLMHLLFDSEVHVKDIKYSNVRTIKVTF